MDIIILNNLLINELYFQDISLTLNILQIIFASTKSLVLLKLYQIKSKTKDAPFGAPSASVIPYKERELRNRYDVAISRN